LHSVEGSLFRQKNPEIEKAILGSSAIPFTADFLGVHHYAWLQCPWSWAKKAPREPIIIMLTPGPYTPDLILLHLCRVRLRNLNLSTIQWLPVKCKGHHLMLCCPELGR
jgi:hypothetical protein